MFQFFITIGEYSGANVKLAHVWIILNGIKLKETNFAVVRSEYDLSGIVSIQLVETALYEV